MRNVIDEIDSRINFDRIVKIAGDLALIGAAFALIGMFTIKPIFWMGVIMMIPFAIVLIIIIVMIAMMLIWFAFKDLWDELKGSKNEQ